MVEIFDDGVEISNPGAFPYVLAIENFEKEACQEPLLLLLSCIGSTFGAPSYTL